eukprot:m.167313 g.167313  ORF g.167313 m.167313 type:complete len:248 (-) comp53164_c0_seq3:194-937(-)
MSDIELDPSIRVWVVGPILAITFLFGLLQHYVSSLIKTHKIPELIAVTETHALQRGQMLAMNAGFIPKRSFLARKKFFNEGENGYYQKNKRSVPAPNPMTDPSMMQDMMKGQLVRMVPMLGVGAVINAVFSGFLTIKVPFPLTPRYKGMLQRGIELTTLSSSWVSSASFYFLCMFGLQSVYGLVLGADNDADQSKMMQQQMSFGQMNTAQDPAKAFQAQWEAIEIVEHKSALEDVEVRLLEATLTTN